ncbi:MAG: NBR1-Ig-like domain-containing protein [Anaerolineales bacterium]|jgi:hypothetical protein
MPGANNSNNPTIDVTQAYHTVEAKLTHAVNQTPTSSPTPIPTDSGLVPKTPSIVPPTAAISPAQTPSNTASPTKLCDQAAPGYPIDVTIPDDTIMEPGQSFTKIWRLQNVGTCTWSQDYSIVFFSGERMAAQVSMPFKSNVQPGNVVDLAVEMIAPKDSGNFQGNWKLRNAANVLFGIGPNGSSPFWVRIQVIHTPTPTFTPVTPTPTHTPTATPPVEVSGLANLAIGDKLDLDINEVNPDEGEDLTYSSSGDGQQEFIPTDETLIGIYGVDQPNPIQCQNTTMESSPITMDTSSIDSYFCYRTNEGRLGWMLIKDMDPDTFTITLDITTWSSP